MLNRYKYFLKAEDELKQMDYLYFINANMLPIRPIDESILPSEDQKLMLCLHPGFEGKPRSTFTYDENPRSQACIQPTEGKHYFMAGFNGGRAEDFLAMSRIINERTQMDIRNDVVALWHDESHLNKYALGKEEDVLILSSKQYGVVEDHFVKKWQVFSFDKFPDQALMVIQNKSHCRFGGHDYLRGKRNSPSLKMKIYRIRMKLAG